MNQWTEAAPSLSSRLSQLFLIGQGFFWISSLFLLNEGVAVAQPQIEQRTLAAVETVVQLTTKALSVKSTSLLPETVLASIEPLPTELLASTLSVTPTGAKTSTAVETVGASNTYIDPTDYSIGATSRNNKPAPIARSTWSSNRVRKKYPVSQKSYSVSLKSWLGRSNIGLIFPLSIPAPVTSLFGWRIHPLTGNLRFHSGTDIGAPLGTPILAAHAGKVAIADFVSGYGLSVSLKHRNATKETLYAHLSEVFVKSGQWVKQGEVIGQVGSTGKVTGPNLHFELRQLTPSGWVAVDPGVKL